MLTFFKDEQLTVPVTASNPLWIFVPNTGGVKHVSLWLADMYCTLVREAADPGADTLLLVDTFRLPDSGTILIDGREITYTSKEAGALHGIPASGVGSIVAPIAVHAEAYPKATYQGSSGLIVSSWGANLSGRGFQVALKKESDARYGIPATPLLYALQNFTAPLEPDPKLKVDLEITVDPGDDIQYDGWEIRTSSFAIPEYGMTDVFAAAPACIYRASQGLKQRFRFYPSSRRLKAEMPGFVFGEHRWREREVVNADALTPTRWDLDAHAVGTEKFISGIGDRDDLSIVSLEKAGHSIVPRMRRGFYFTGHSRHYCPADPQLEIFSLNGGLSFDLAKDPRAQAPIFVGAYKLDAEGHYDTFVEYRAVGPHPFDEDSEYQFGLDRSRRKVTLNKPFGLPLQFLGVTPGSDRAVFDIPVFPVGAILRVYMGPYQSSPEESIAWSYDGRNGRLSVTFPEGTPAGRDIYVECLPAVAVVYDAGTGFQDRLLPIDLNPAFAGIARGHLYLQHRRQQTGAIELFADKGRIVIPKEYELVSGLVAYGPVYYENDFALLQAAAYGRSSKELVPNRHLKVLVDPDRFRGSLNYLDPLNNDVYIVTGGDGKANLIYTPPDGYGYYLDPAASVSGAEVTLPVPVELSQLWNADEGWRTYLYYVTNDDGFFGKVGADVAMGEIPWAVSGAPGTAAYKTNGRRFCWKQAGKPVQPLRALDAAGVAHTEPGFSGQVSRLVYNEAVLTVSSLGSYFFTFAGRVTLQVLDEETGAVSNQILLQLETPPEIADESGVAGFLIVNQNLQGRLNVNRLGGAPLLPANVTTTRY